MYEVWFYSLASVFIVSLISFVGLFALGMRAERLRVLLIYFISFAAGALFGDAFFHMIPEIVKSQGFGFSVSVSFLGGIVLFFVIEKAIHVQHYHSHNLNESGKEHKHKEIEPFVYTNLIGDVVHNLGDGIIIAVSYLISIPVGIATSLAVAFHEIPHEVGNFSILVHGGFSRKRALFINFLTALSAVAGAILALIVGDFAGNLEGFLLPIAAGGFIYVAGSDLIPELHKDSDKFSKALWQLVLFVAGMGLMALLLLMG